ASTKRQQRSSIVITKQRDLKFGLSAIARATHVAVLLVDQFTVRAHHIKPGVRRPFERVRWQQQKIIQDRHLLLFTLANHWLVTWVEAHRDLKRGARVGFVLQFAFQKQVPRLEPATRLYASHGLTVRRVWFWKVWQLS